MRIIFTVLLGVLCTFPMHAQEGLDACLDDLGKRLSLRLTFLEKTHVAVSDLVTLEGDSNALGMAASEELTVSLVHHALNFEVMDRAHLRAIFAEHRLALGGLMNDSTLIRLGRLESVDAIVTGTITQLSDRYKITVKALDTETASVLAAERGYCLRTRELDRAFAGSATPVDVVVNPLPDPPTHTDCESSRTGHFQLINHSDKTVELTVEALGCKTRQTHVLAPGEAMTMNGLCAGMVQWKAQQGAWRKGGSVYIHPCDRRSVTLVP